MKQSGFGMCRAGAWLAALLLGAAGCSGGSVGDTEDTSTLSAALTQAEVDRIMGFENPTSDWAATWYWSQLSASSEAAQGTKALKVVMNYASAGVTHVKVDNRIGTPSEVSFLFKAPAMANPAGTLKLQVNSPTLNLWSVTLGQKDLSSWPRDVYQRASFQVPATVSNALAKPFSDLKFTITWTAAAPGTYYLDDFQLGAVASTCVEGATRTGAACGLNNNGTLGETCTAGQWVSNGICTDPDACVNGSSRPGSGTCGLNNNGTKLDSCVAGQWALAASCADPDVCENGTNRVGSTKCGINLAGGFQQICSSGQWVDSSQCVDTDVCVNGSSQSGSTACGLNQNGTLVRVCAAGEWVDGATCTDPDVCTNGSTQRGTTPCGSNNEGSLKQVCSEGQWADGLECTTSRVTYLYVGSYDGNIRIYSVNEGTGQLTWVTTLATPNGLGWAAVASDGLTLFGGYWGNELREYNFNPLAGTLSLGSMAATAGPASHVAISPTGRHVFTTHYSAGKLSGVPFINGVLGASTVYQPGAGTHQTVIHPNNRWAFVTALDAGLVKQFAFDGTSGILTPQVVPQVSVSGGPRFMDFHPDGSALYVLTQSSSQVYVFDINQTTGTLITPARQVIAAVSGGSWAHSSDLHVSQNGKFVFAINRYNQDIVTFRVNADHSLVWGSRAVLNAQARVFALSPSGSHLHVGDLNGRLSTWSIDPVSGALTWVNDITGLGQIYSVQSAQVQ
ncbi:MAG: beta-propeller fold lactonase family protein [Polyangiaceae bacterium]|nr:beta-propeller fold lactonase family protein [Polyangiaceae bacterium]